MPPILRSNAILMCAAASIVSTSATVLAGPAITSALGSTARSPIIFVKDNKPIDETCLMVCVKWNGDNCEKFEMKCKGDPGYPTANTVRPGKATSAGTLGNAGAAGNAGNAGKVGNTLQKAQ